MKTMMYTININKRKTREERRREAADAIITAVTTVLMLAVLALAFFGLGAILG